MKEPRRTPTNVLRDSLLSFFAKNGIRNLSLQYKELGAISLALLVAEA